MDFAISSYVLISNKNPDGNITGDYSNSEIITFIAIHHGTSAFALLYPDDIYR